MGQGADRGFAQLASQLVALEQIGRDVAVGKLGHLAQVGLLFWTQMRTVIDKQAHFLGQWVLGEALPLRDRRLLILGMIAGLGAMLNK